MIRKGEENPQPIYIYFKCLQLKTSGNSYSLQVKLWKMYISQSENSKLKILKFINPVRIKHLLRFALSLTVSEITANLLFLGHVTFRVL